MCSTHTHTHIQVYFDVPFHIYPPSTHTQTHACAKSSNISVITVRSQEVWSFWCILTIQVPLKTFHTRRRTIPNYFQLEKITETRHPQTKRQTGRPDTSTLYEPTKKILKTKTLCPVKWMTRQLDQDWSQCATDLNMLVQHKSRTKTIWSFLKGIINELPWVRGKGHLEHALKDILV